MAMEPSTTTSTAGTDAADSLSDGGSSARASRAPPEATDGDPSRVASQRPTAALHLWEIAWVRDLFGLALAALVLESTYSLRGILTPVLVALVLAYIFDPLFDFAERRLRAPRPVSVGLVVVLLLGTVAGLVSWAGPQLAQQLSSLADRLPTYGRHLATRLSLDLGGLDDALTATLVAVGSDPLGALRSVFAGTSNAMGLVGDVLDTATYAVMTMVLIPVCFFFFAWKLPAMTAHLKRLVPTSRRTRVDELLSQLDAAVSGFFRSRLLIGLIMAVLFGIGWSPWLTDVPYWALLAAATGLASIIPYAAAAGWLLVLLLKYLEMTAGGATPTNLDLLIGLAGPTAVYAVVQAFEGWLLTPWIQGHTTGLSAIAVILVVLVGGAVAGLFGMLLAIPIAACAKILFREVLLPRIDRWAAQS